MSRRGVILSLIVLAFLATVLFPTFTALVTDWWWFQEIGYQAVFTRPLVTSLLLFLVVGALTFAALYANLRLAQRGLVPYPVALRFTRTAPRIDIIGPLRRFSLPASLVIAVLAGLGATGAWDLVLRVLYATPFGIKDPIFSRDVGYYVFTLPALASALGLVSTLLVLSLIVTVPVYLLRGDIMLGAGVGRVPRLRIEPSAGWHIATLLAGLFVVTALRLWLVDAPGLLYSTTGPLVGASYTDLHATLPALRVSAVVALLAAVLVLYGAMRRELGRYAVLAIGG
jgi:uncharacterized membrane protein (UPF0182 family)